MLLPTSERKQIYIGMKEDQTHFIFCDGFRTAIPSDDTVSDRLSLSVCSIGGGPSGGRGFQREAS